MIESANETWPHRFINVLMFPVVQEYSEMQMVAEVSPVAVLHSFFHTRSKCYHFFYEVVLFRHGSRVLCLTNTIFSEFWRRRRKMHERLL